MLVTKENLFSPCCSEWDQPHVDMRPPGSIPIKVTVILLAGA